MTWFIAGLALAGNVLVIRKSRWGFGCWIVSNIYLAYHNYAVNESAQATLFGVYLMLALWGWLKWSSHVEDAA